jgi:hypothetical protein
MKTKAITLICTAVVSFATAAPVLADDQRDPAVVAADAVIMRPAMFGVTVLGSAIFVVSLPVAALSKSVKSTAHALVVAPAKGTFTRPLGDFDYHDRPSDLAAGGVTSTY